MLSVNRTKDFKIYIKQVMSKFPPIFPKGCELVRGWDYSSLKWNFLPKATGDIKGLRKGKV